MNTNTVLSKSIDNQAVKISLQSLPDKKRTKVNPKTATTDCFPYLYVTRSNKTSGLIKIQIEFTEKKFTFN